MEEIVIEEFELPEELEPVDISHDSKALTDALESLRDVQRLAIDIRVAGGISIQEATVMRRLTIGMECADAHFDRHPIASYTRLSSNVNYRATQEGILGAAIELAKKMLKAAVKFVLGLLDKLWWKLMDRQRTVRSIEANQKKMSKFFEGIYKSADKNPNIPDIIAQMEQELASRWTAGFDEVYRRRFTMLANEIVGDVGDGVYMSKAVLTSLINGASDADIKSQLDDVAKVMPGQLQLERIAAMQGTYRDVLVPDFPPTSLTSISYSLEQEYMAMDQVMNKLERRQKERKELVALLHDLDKGIGRNLIAIDPNQSQLVGNVLNVCGSHLGNVLELCNRNLDDCQRLSKLLGELGNKALAQIRKS